MPRSAKSPSRRKTSLLADDAGMAWQLLAGAGAAIARNPVLVGGTTAFLVAMSYVSTNALWYQPHFHSDAFFQTRSTLYQGPDRPRTGAAAPAVRETTIRIDRTPQATAPLPSDPRIARVQTVLHDLNFYAGEIDGLSGPNTRQAVEAYQKTIGLPVTGEIDAALVDQLGAAATTTAAIAPVPSPRAASPVEQATTAAGDPNPRIVKIQAGLKAFGNDGMELDGVVGSRTRAAIREFQSLFGLEVSGEPDEAVYAKMREIGLTN